MVLVPCRCTPCTPGVSVSGTTRITIPATRRVNKAGATPRLLSRLRQPSTSLFVGTSCWCTEIWLAETTRPSTNSYLPHLRHHAISDDLGDYDYNNDNDDVTTWQIYGSKYRKLANIREQSLGGNLRTSGSQTDPGSITIRASVADTSTLRYTRYDVSHSLVSCRLKHVIWYKMRDLVKSTWFYFISGIVHFLSWLHLAWMTLCMRS